MLVEVCLVQGRRCCCCVRKERRGKERASMKLGLSASPRESLPTRRLLFPNAKELNPKFESLNSNLLLKGTYYLVRVPSVALCTAVVRLKLP